MDKTTLQIAIEYATRGWHIFPVHTVDSHLLCSCGERACSDAGKHPRVARGLKEASRDIAKIEEWFGPLAPPSNIGISTGEVSGITVIDVDTGQGKFGAESWAEIVKEHGEPQTLMAQTGSGGFHLIFRYNSALKTASNVLGKGIDCRNDGGYIVAPPSRHRTGGVYTWINWGDEVANLPKHLSQRKETRGRPRKDDVFRSKYTIEQVEDMLYLIPSEDRDLWRNVGIILGRQFERMDEAWQVYVKWADKAGGKKGRNHDEIMREAFYELSIKTTEKELSIGTIVKAAIDAGWSPKTGDVPIGNFVYYGPGNNYIYRPTTSYWIAGAVDAAVSTVNERGKIIKASEWLKVNQLATSITCDPLLDSDYSRGVDCRDGEIMNVAGAAIFNTYRKPTIELGDARLAAPFVRHVHNIFSKPGDADQFLDYMAHRVQKPWEKPRFALLIAGGQGVGKDTAIEMCCPAIGTWNVANIDPGAFDTSFNEFVSSTLVRISEAANLHEMSKWAFNERTKVLIGGSPDTCQVNPKYGQKFSVRMHCGVIITTNHLANGIYIPADDRRYDVIETATMQQMGIEDPAVRKAYFSELWDWYGTGGASHIAAMLTERDISKFSPNNGQRKTEAHNTVVAGGLHADSWLDDIIEELGRPIGLRSDWIISRAVAQGEKEPEVRRKMASAIGRLDYLMYKNPSAKDGRWKVEGKKTTVYVKAGTSQDYDPVKQLSNEPF